MPHDMIWYGVVIVIWNDDGGLVMIGYGDDAMVMIVWYDGCNGDDGIRMMVIL